MNPTKRTKQLAARDRVVALALTWDGARCPIRTLPPRARAFLANRSLKVPSARQTAALLAADAVTEIRICWIPRLKGGNHVLSAPFTTRSGKRLPFRPTKTITLGDILAVIYRR